MASPPDRPGSTANLDPLLDSAPVGFLSIDGSGIVRIANATLARLVGRERDAIEHQHIDGLLPVAGRIFFSTHLFPMLRLHGRAEELYVPLVSSDGTEIPVMVNGVSRTDDSESRYDLVLVPMRERNRLEDELIAARNLALGEAAAKDRFLSIVSHELRAPIAGVSGFAELLLRERVGPLNQKQRGYAERIRDAAAYQVRLIEDILEFAALVGERRALEPLVVPVEEIIGRAESILAIRAAEDGHAIERTPRPAPGSVMADAGAVQQIILNLGVNAIKFSPRGTRIMLAVAPYAGRVRVSITDHGPGIEPEAVERIFEPFVQLPGSEVVGRRGVGLGLSISRDLARAMGGEIVVDSTPGEGSTFTLELPEASRPDGGSRR